MDTFWIVGGLMFVGILYFILRYREPPGKKVPDTSRLPSIDLMGEKIIRIESRVLNFAGQPYSKFPAFSQLRFTDGTRLSDVTMCGLMEPFIESGFEGVFYFMGDEKKSTLIAVQIPQGYVQDVDDTPLHW